MEVDFEGICDKLVVRVGGEGRWEEESRTFPIDWVKHWVGVDVIMHLVETRRGMKNTCNIKRKLNPILDYRMFETLRRYSNVDIKWSVEYPSLEITAEVKDNDRN